MAREWPKDPCCNSCSKLRNIVPKDLPTGEANKFLYFACLEPEINRKIDLEEIVNPELIPCERELYVQIPRQCVGTLRWKGSPHLLESGIKMRCRRSARVDKTVCYLHGGGTRKREAKGKRAPVGRNKLKNLKKKTDYFKQETLEMIEAFKNDPDLLNVEFELASLKTLQVRIEKSDMTEVEKIEALRSILDTISKNVERREKIIEQRRYSLGIEKIEILIQSIFEAVKRVIPEEDKLKKIGIELSKIVGQLSNVNNKPGIPELTGIQEDDEGEIIEAELIPTKKQLIPTKKLLPKKK